MKESASGRRYLSISGEGLKHQEAMMQKAVLANATKESQQAIGPMGASAQQAAKAGCATQQTRSGGGLAQLAALMNGSSQVHTLTQLRTDSIQPNSRVQELMRLAAEINQASPVQPSGAVASENVGNAVAAGTLAEGTSCIEKAGEGSATAQRAIRSVPSGGQGIVQRMPLTARVTGITHLVKAKDGSVFEGNEYREVEAGNILRIETTQKLRSRRGPNQEMYRRYDAAGPQVYRWFKVIAVDGDPIHEDVYVRDDAIVVEHDRMLGERPSRLSPEQRTRPMPLEDVLDPRAAKWANISPGDAWEKARNPDRFGATAAKNAFDYLWTSCGQASESLQQRLEAAGGRLIELAKLEYIGTADANKLGALLKLPVRDTTLLVVRDPGLHEFTIEKHSNGNCYLHQGYISNFSALWWAGLTQEHVMGPRVKETVIASRAQFGNRQPIDILALADGMAAFLASDTYGEGALAAWNRLPFVPSTPKESSISTSSAQIRLVVDIFQLGDEAAVRAAFGALHSGCPLFELVLREAAEIQARIEAKSREELATRDQAVAPQNRNPMLGALGARTTLRSTGRLQQEGLTKKTNGP
jgi:hypothetical protein